MKRFRNQTRGRTAGPHGGRQGLSLLEVIACIILISVIIIPISGMMRSSARTMATAQGLTDETRSIDAFRHMRNTIKSAVSYRTLGARNQRLEIVNPTGSVVTWHTRGRVLVEENNGVRATLVPQVSDLQFALVPRANPGPSGVLHDLAVRIERSNQSGRRTVRQTLWIEGPQ